MGKYKIFNNNSESLSIIYGDIQEKGGAKQLNQIKSKTVLYRHIIVISLYPRSFNEFNAATAASISPILVEVALILKI